MLTQAKAQLRRDRMLAAAIKERVPDVMTLGSIVAAASAMSTSGGGMAASLDAAAWDDRDTYFHAAISEGHWLSLLVSAGLLNDTVGLNAARGLFMRYAVVQRVRAKRRPASRT